MAATLTEILASQDDLVKEASLALPHSFSNCTFPLGSLRQAVYLCLTCALPRGICSSCSVACHTHHEQIELFPKRNFRCDCPTSALPHACTLHRTLEDENTSNIYGQNFKGIFCRCGRPYHPEEERETMIQCLACEDWFHESCLNLRERPSSPELTPAVETEPIPDQQAEHVQGDADDAASDTSSSSLPPPLISGSEYESFICGSCVSRIDIMKQWAGTLGMLMVTRTSPSAPWTIFDGSRINEKDAADSLDVVAESEASAGVKRPRPSSDTDATEAKRPRVSPSSSSEQQCLAPPSNPTAQKILAAYETTEKEFSQGTGDIFLTEGWRERWCRCASCLPSLEAHPYLLEEEETYEPPEDPDSGLSLEELGMRALQNLPRDRAIDGIRAFNDMRDDLLKYLRPFAQEGKVVDEAAVRTFFEDRLEGRRNA